MATSNGSAANAGPEPAQPRRQHRGSVQSMDAAPFGYRYVRMINGLSDRSPKCYFYAGEQYIGLRNHIKTSQDPFSKPQRQQHASNGEPHAPQPTATFPFVVVKDFPATSSPPCQKYVPLQSPDELQDLADTTDGSSRIIFMRGFASGQWVSHIGERLRVEPEFFRQHLRFLSQTDYYGEPAWPSLSTGSLRLRFPTIINRRKNLTRPEVESMRRREFSGATEYLDDLVRSDNVGGSMMRRMCILDDITFVFDQEVTITFAKPQRRATGVGSQDKGGGTNSSGPGWTGLIWLDHGKLLPFEGSVPWQRDPKMQTGGADKGADCVPLLQRLPPHLYDKLNATPAHDLGDATDTATHGAFFLPFSYGATLDPALMKADRFYGLSEIIAFAINSQNQFLNRINHGINQTMEEANNEKLWALDHVDDSRNLLARAMTDLNYARRLLADTHVYLDDLKAFLDEDSIKRFTGQESGLSDAGRKARVAIMQDLDCALRRVTSLHTSTSEGANFIANEVMLIDSALSTSTARVARRLNLLLCSFVPASLVVGFFGINVHEFDSGNVRIWVVIATFVPVTLVVLCFAFYLEIQGWVEEGKRQFKEGWYPHLRRVKGHLPGRRHHF